MIQDTRFRFDGNTPGPNKGRVAGRFESDAEALPFPVGGVFGPIEVEAPAPKSEDWDSMDTLSAIEHVIDRMQDQLTELETDFEDVIAHIGGEDGGWRPTAA